MKTGETLVLNYKKTNSYALNVLAGAVEMSPECAGVEIVFARTPEALCQAVREANTHGRRAIVAWSFYSPQFEENYAELRAIRADLADADAIHLIGGVHATAEPEHVLRNGFDCAAVGEGEKLIGEFLVKVQRGEDPRTTKGIAHLDGDRYVANGQAERIELDDFPGCAPKHFRFNPIEITRGCVYACAFCQTPFMFKAKFRHRSVENICAIVREMKANDVTDVRFITPTCMSYGSPDESVNLAKIEELLSSVRAILGPDGRLFFGAFPSELRPEHVTREALAMLKKYVDNDNLIVGGQSGSQSILDATRRGHSVESIVEAVRLTAEAGFVPNVDFIFGLPGETAGDIEASLKLAEQLGDLGARIHAHAFMPLPGTPLKSAAPGILAESTTKRLEKLASRGAVYGQWKQQMNAARALGRMRAMSQ